MSKKPLVWVKSEGAGTNCAATPAIILDKNTRIDILAICPASGKRSTQASKQANNIASPTYHPRTALFLASILYLVANIVIPGGSCDRPPSHLATISRRAMPHCRGAWRACASFD